MIRKLCLSITLLCACSVATARDTGYIEMGIGSVDYGFESIADFNNPTGFEFLIGNEVSRNLSFELSYMNFGEADNGAVPEMHLDADSITAGMLLMAKAGKTGSVFLKFGMHNWDSELIQRGSGVISEDDGTDIFYGLGAMVRTTEGLSIGARYNVYDFDGNNVTMLSINARISF